MSQEKQAAVVMSRRVDRRGAVTVEYAVVLALIAATVALGWGLLAKESTRPLTQLARGMDSTHHHEAPSSGRNAAKVPGQTHGHALDNRPLVSRSPSWWTAEAAVALAVQMVFFAILMGLIYRRRKRQSDQSGELSDAPLNDLIFHKRQSMLRQLAGDDELLSTGRLLARHLMSAPSSFVTPEASAEKVAQLMTANRVRHLLVRDRSDRLVGIISDRDVSSRKGRTAADIMTPSPTTVDHDTPLGPAMTMLIRKRISCVPVMRNGSLCGVLTTTDIVLALQCILHVLEGRHLETTSPPAEASLSATADAEQADELCVATEEARS